MASGSMLLVNNVAQSDQIFLKGAILLSDLFRLEPLMLSNINEILQMDADTAIKNSLVYLNPFNICPLLLAAGTDETDEFKDQSFEMYNSWENKHASIELLKIPHKNHYSILDAVTENSSSLQSAIFRLMNIDG